MATRINRFFANATKTCEKRTILHDQLRRSIAIIKTATPTVASGYPKSWCNAWITSRRAQSQIGKCKFGCPASGGKDELEHYIRCPALCAPINSMILQKTGIALGSTPGEFLTFCPPHTRPSETRHAKNSKSDLSANRAARIIRLHLANDVTNL